MKLTCSLLEIFKEIVEIFKGKIKETPHVALISSRDLAELRQAAATRTSPTYTKSVINAALQAIEDTFENARPALNTAINTATAPFVFTAAQKKILVALWAQKKFEREGV